MSDRRARLLAVAHGTASTDGSAVTAELAAAVAAVRPDVRVDLCFLDVVHPRLADALDAAPGVPTVVVPLLLSTGYHVRSDIPDAVSGRTDVVAVARHLGPHPLLVDALIDRLREAGADPAATTVLVGSGSSRPEARAELLEVCAQLGARLGRSVELRTMADDLASAIADNGGPVTAVSYFVAEGRFATTLREAAAGGEAVVTAPIGVHPALVQLVWTRYDEALGTVG